MEKRFYELRPIIEDAFKVGNWNTSKALAEEYLQLATHLKNNWNYGNAIHHGNIILGRIMLRDGKIKEAKEYLLKAGKTPGSPQIRSFGPNMSLANELLEHHESSVVLEYLDLSRNFWWFPFRMFSLPKWKKQIKLGQIPDFKANLVY
jgi:hypothetical protein